jgi:hypothetical protein
MHPADNVADEYGKLVRERKDLERKLQQPRQWMKRIEEIDAAIAELRKKMGEALTAPAQAIEEPAKSE